MAKEAALVVPQIRCIGWDVRVTPTGAAIIEGNTYPGYGFWQLPEHAPDKIGLYSCFRNRIPEYTQVPRTCWNFPGKAEIIAFSIDRFYSVGYNIQRLFT